MIRFTLTCSREHEFEGWFRDNDTFKHQAEAGQVACPVCADVAVRKAIMAPAVTRTRAMETVTREQARQALMLHMARKVREHVEKNFEPVGDRFAKEARKIHYGEADKREIWGSATVADAKELHEEGIPVQPLPELPELDG
jgi:hypothetical protein